MRVSPLLTDNKGGAEGGDVLKFLLYKTRCMIQLPPELKRKLYNLVKKKKKKLYMNKHINFFHKNI